MKHLSLKLLAETVVIKRKALKLSQAAVSDKTGINRSILSRLETEDYTPTVDQLLALAHVLGFELTDVLTSGEAGHAAVSRQKIAVAGMGYVGLSLAVLLSQHNDVTAVDIVPEKVAKLSRWESPIQDDYIEKYLAEHEARRLSLSATTDAGAAYPDVYIESNLIGFFNILEACRHNPVEHLVYASSSSVYGGSRKVPFSTEDMVDNPVSLYAATKKSNELLAHSYSKLYNIPSTGLRFFTVYGPAGRPDMFYYSATEKLVKGETISIFNYGNCQRDFTYVDDIVEGVLRVMQGAPEKATGEDGLPLPPYAVYNIGGGTPEKLLDYISTLQEELVRGGVLPVDYDFEAHRELVGMQPGDVPVTYADSTGLERDYGFRPSIGIREGLRRFAEWYGGYYLGR